jgi:hypothetical protein
MAVVGDERLTLIGQAAQGLRHTEKHFTALTDFLVLEPLRDDDVPPEVRYSFRGALWFISRVSERSTRGYKRSPISRVGRPLKANPKK